MVQGPSGEADPSSPSQEIPTFCGTRRFITVQTYSEPLESNP
jgi:hypothetical protein